MPFAAVLPCTPLIETCSPANKPVVLPTVIVIGDVLLAPEMVIGAIVVPLIELLVGAVGIGAAWVQVLVDGVYNSAVAVKTSGEVYSPPIVKNRPSGNTRDVSKSRFSAGVDQVPEFANEVQAPLT